MKTKELKECKYPKGMKIDGSYYPPLKFCSHCKKSEKPEQIIDLTQTKMYSKPLTPQSEIREKIHEILIRTCGQECSNGSDNDFRAVDEIMALFSQSKESCNHEKYLGKYKITCYKCNPGQPTEIGLVEFDENPQYGGIINFASNGVINEKTAFDYGFRLGWQTCWYEHDIRKEAQSSLKQRIVDKLNQALFYSEDKKKRYNGEILANHIMDIRDDLEKLTPRVEDDVQGY